MKLFYYDDYHYKRDRECANSKLTRVLMQQPFPKHYQIENSLLWESLVENEERVTTTLQSHFVGFGLETATAAAAALC